ncbi:hypothetical protein CI1B_48920 [Bradyrhizobium ivorense]|uniref:Uncharacterized protein n=1 Tax=Bradyrhizobium ivorense TaxID=2511166 RepID=A0A508TGF4_9BRAD|nr:hypothetical protein [Bradyrhizobium ivorense]VIO73287.1 hypothetical protein CI1B_48920 [Bradyrhizobium ivorense]
MSFLEKMRDAAKQFEAPPDPWRKPLENALKGVDAMSTVALLDLVGARRTTQNARRLAAIMRDLTFIPIQSRRLMPGGFRDTVTRGWARPIRGSAQSSTRYKGETAGWDRPSPTREGST